MASDKEQVAKLISRISAILESAQKELAKFKTNLDKNPTYAFEWGSQAMYAAAQIDTLSRGLRYLIDNTEHTDGDKVRNFVKDLEDQVFRAARSINNHSTSNMSNAMTEHKLAAAASFLDSLKWAGIL